MYVYVRRKFTVYCGFVNMCEAFRQQQSYNIGYLEALIVYSGAQLPRGAQELSSGVTGESLKLHQFKTNSDATRLGNGEKLKCSLIYQKQ